MKVSKSQYARIRFWLNFFAITAYLQCQISLGDVLQLMCIHDNKVFFLFLTCMHFPDFSYRKIPRQQCSQNLKKSKFIQVVMVLLSSPSSVLKPSKGSAFCSNSLYRLNSVEDLMANPGLVAETKEVLKTLPDLERLLKKQEKFVYFLSLSQKKSSGIWRSYRSQRDVCSNPSLMLLSLLMLF